MKVSDNHLAADNERSEQWFWRSGIDIADWEKSAEAWLPAQATLNALSSAAVLPDALGGLWPKGDQGVKLADLYSWFDGNHAHEEETQPGYPPESRPIPRADYTLVKKTLSKAVQDGSIWLVFGNDSVFHDAPTAIQLDADAVLYRPPTQLAAIDLLPAVLNTPFWPHVLATTSLGQEGLDFHV